MKNYQIGIIAFILVVSFNWFLIHHARRTVQERKQYDVGIHGNIPITISNGDSETHLTLSPPLSNKPLNGWYDTTIGTFTMRIPIGYTISIDGINDTRNRGSGSITSIYRSIDTNQVYSHEQYEQIKHRIDSIDTVNIKLWIDTNHSQLKKYNKKNINRTHEGHIIDSTDSIWKVPTTYKVGKMNGKDSVIYELTFSQKYYNDPIPDRYENIEWIVVENTGFNIRRDIHFIERNCKHEWFCWDSTVCPMRWSALKRNGHIIIRVPAFKDIQ